MDFGEYGDLIFWLFLVSLANMDLFYSREDPIVDIQGFIDPPGPPTSNHLTYLPFLNTLILAHQIILHYPILRFLKQEGNIVANGMILLTIITIF